MVFTILALVVCGIILYPTLKKKRAEHSINPSESTMAIGSSSLRNRSITVVAEILKPQQMTEKSVTTGSIRPAEEVDLQFETSGKIIAIYFREGELVKKGTLLARINDAPLQAQLKKLESQVKLAADRVYRQQTLLERDAVSQEAYESVLTEYNKLQADIELVKAQIDQTELKAPFDGIIGLREVSEGAFASTSTRIASLAQVSELKIDFSVPESYASEIKRGTPITFSLTDNNGRTQNYSATVYAVESTINTDTRTLSVRAMYSNKNNSLLPGRYIAVEITRQIIDDALSVPSESIIPEMGENIVYLYKNGTAQPVKIITGMRTADRVQALSGLNTGDTLLVTGVMQLRQGMNVTIDQIL